MRFDEIGVMPPLSLLLTHSRKKYLRAVSELGGSQAESGALIDRADGVTDCFWSDDGSLLCLVYLSPDPGRTDAQDAGLIAHEAVHVAQGYLEWIGEDEPGAELEAYVTQYAAQRLGERHWHWKAKRIKREGKGR